MNIKIITTVIISLLVISYAGNFVSIVKQKDYAKYVAEENEDIIIPTEPCLTKDELKVLIANEEM